MYYPLGQPPLDVEVLWRCKARRYSYIIDADADKFGVTEPRLEMLWYRIIKRTPKGARLYGKFVLLTAKKQWACETEAQALTSFIARKERQISILNAKLQSAKQDLALTKERAFA